MQDMNSGNEKEKLKKEMISDQAKKELRPMFYSYFKLKDYLVQDNFDKAVQSGMDMNKALDNISMGIFNGEAHIIWMKYQPTLKNNLQHIDQMKSIDDLRNAFIGISSAMIALSESFGSLNGEVYVQHCPMADNHKGADWLSKEKNIKNPYFGSAMLACGEVKETIQ